MAVATTVRDGVNAVMDAVAAGIDIADGGEIFGCINFCSKERSK